MFERKIMNNQIFCSLCDFKLEEFQTTRKRKYYLCSNCQSIQMDPSFFLSLEAEKKRYELHNNDVEDINYQTFVKPITDYILNNHNSKEQGLDFGAGTGPVITKLLKDQNYQIELYDPFFWNDPNLLYKQYDYIIACEVIEHFHNPKKDFALLKSLLKENGVLILMTNLYQEEIVFSDWHYKNDETHVFFYSKETFEFIKKRYNFNKLYIKDKLVVFQK